jgi:hypothetical protein
MSSTTSRSRFSGFDSYYKLKILPLLEASDKQRKSAFRMFVMVPSIAFPAGLAFDFYQESDGFLNGFGIFAAVFTTVIGFAIYTTKAKNSDGIKAEVLPMICRYFGLEHNPKPSGRLQPEQYRELGLLPDWDLIRQKDEIAGRYREIEVALVQAKLTQTPEASNGKKGRKDSIDVFRGLLVVCDLPENLRGSATIVIGRKGENHPDLAPVRIEDPAFGERFDVYSDDPTEAQVRLTPPFMEQLLQLESLPGHDGLGLAIFGETLFLTLETPGDLFEYGATPISKSLVDRQRIDTMVEQVSIIIDVVETLNPDA